MNTFHCAFVLADSCSPLHAVASFWACASNPGQGSPNFAKERSGHSHDACLPIGKHVLHVFLHFPDPHTARADPMKSAEAGCPTMIDPLLFCLFPAPSPSSPPNTPDPEVTDRAGSACEEVATGPQLPKKDCCRGGCCNGCGSCQYRGDASEP